MRSSKRHLQSSESMAAFCLMIFFLIHAPVLAGESCNNRYSEYGFALVAHVYKSFFTDRLVSCYMSCSTQPACQSLNYNLADKTCEFNNDTKYFRPNHFVEKSTWVYAENPDSGKFFFPHICWKIILIFLLYPLFFFSK